MGCAFGKRLAPGGEGYDAEETTESREGSVVGEPPAAILGPTVAVPGGAELEQTQ